ncbi:MAG: type II CRISPR RNA-guided endonuclease Cas9 [Hylemonella sp.]
MPGMRYRLALDLGSTSLGWAMIRLKGEQPVAVIKAGVRIFSDGRNPKDGSSLAVTRRQARAMRRRRDRLLKRKARMLGLLVRHGFFPATEPERKSLERLNPYELRARGLNGPLTPAEFARALFHINQRRGFRSNRKTDRQESDSGALKKAISALQQQLDPTGANGKARTVGELLWRRMQAGQGVRARYRERRLETENGKSKIDKSYDLYIDRSMIEAEFDALWSSQARFNPGLFTEQARTELRDCLLHQRRLRPALPGRCTLLPDESRAPLALPSQQRFRIYQEVNHLRILTADLEEKPLTLQQRDVIVEALERHGKRSFTQIKTLLKLPGDAQFNLEDAKRQELKGNATSAVLGKKNLFGDRWFEFDEQKQDEIVLRLLEEESEANLIAWLTATFELDEARAEAIANVNLPEGYGSLSSKALNRILPALKSDVVTYDKAVQLAGFDHHSQISHAAVTGEILPHLPYYGEHLQRHVGFGTNNPQDPPEKRYGKIANPTVHIGLNQIRTVVNELIRRYGHPSEVIIEVARDLKQSREQRKEQQAQQARNQKRNERLREQAAGLLGITQDRVKPADIQKLILWEELSDDVAQRRCPYSGVQISAAMVLTDEVEVEHILPFSQTLDDSLNNKTIATRQANRVKGNRTPWDARDDFERQGWRYDDILRRAENMPRAKRYRFGPDGYQQWLKEDRDFLARALNDTRYLSRVAREYLSLICPQATRVIPGQMTALLRAKFGLNDILGLEGEKNRNDHRHHAVDACVIGVTDQGMLQRFAQASARARERQLDRLVDEMPLPWPSYREHVARAVSHIWVSHKPDHGYEGGFTDDTTYRPPHLDHQNMWRTRGIGGANPNARAPDAPMIPIYEPSQTGKRHRPGPNGEPLPYKGYMGGSNYCIEITRTPEGRWQGDVISTFKAYEIVRKDGLKQLRHPTQGQNGQPLVMRLSINDTVRMTHDGKEQTMRMVKVASSGQIWFAPVHEANVDARNSDKLDPFAYVSKTASTLKKAQARQVTISPTGELRDPGFRE